MQPRTVIIGQASRSIIDAMIMICSLVRFVVTLIKRNASGIQVKISCLCLKLIKHGTDDRIGSYIAFCKGIRLGEQVFSRESLASTAPVANDSQQHN